VFIEARFRRPPEKSKLSRLQLRTIAHKRRKLRRVEGFANAPIRVMRQLFTGMSFGILEGPKANGRRHDVAQKVERRGYEGAR
jgi:hypothetical protein